MRSPGGGGANPLLEPKLFVPRPRRGPRPRPRLSERLDRGGASKLMLVSKSKGWGNLSWTRWRSFGGN